MNHLHPAPKPARWTRSLNLAAAVWLGGAFVAALSCSVDYNANQAEYDRKLCESRGACSDGGSDSSGGEAGGPAQGATASGGDGATMALGGRPAPNGGAGGDAVSPAGAGGSENTPCANGEKRCNSGNAEECVGGEWSVTVCANATPACEAGTCVVCVNTAGRCDGQTPEVCEAHKWSAKPACTGQSFCETGQCFTPPSCVGLAADCGTSGESCCASNLVPGGDFYRNNLAINPATVSDYLLDKYEVTVGRFRKFLAAYPGNKPAANDGARPNLAGSGWQAAWDVNLAVTANVLATNLKCNGFATWTDAAGGNEKRPLNCLDWYTAFAFCAWDGGWLPTDLEWNYAAAGGSEQRLYPWGDTAPPLDATHAVYNCYYMGSGSSCSLFNGNIGPVGSASAGAGLWGHLDLVGNVEEWLLDISDPYPPTCVDCANLGTNGSRVLRGSYFSNFADSLKTTLVNSGVPSIGGSTLGVRCARLP